MKYLILTLIFLPFSTFSQKHDNTWIIGGSSVNGIFDGYQWGTMICDFDKDPVEFRYDEKITMDTYGLTSSVCDSSGRLLMYSNGMYVENGLHNTVPGLDTISYGTYWENFNEKDYLPDGSDWKSGFPIRKGVMMLPSFVPDEYILFSILRTNPENDGLDDTRTTRLLTSQIRFDNLNPMGKVIYKEQPLLDGYFQGGFSACRHANGRDWWIVHNAEFNTAIYVFLYTPDGINLVDTFTDVTPIQQRQSFVAGNFSTNGEKYVTSETVGQNFDQMLLTIYGFNRCTGKLVREENKSSNQFILVGAVAYSDNDLLYVTNGEHMFQYDLNAKPILSSETIVATYDGSTFAYVDGGYKQNLFFSTMWLGPDGKIYCTPPGNVRSMHTIEYPHERGTAAHVTQNKFVLPTQNFNSMPNFPNYRLGPLDGSPCDTLGIDNHPIAKYRYGPDTIDHLRIRFTDLSYFRPETWSWDFGDGSPKISMRHPYHTYTAGGTYRVCLTVSNENSANTYCRDITIGPSASDDIAGESAAAITLFPNPVEDILLVTLGEYIPAQAYITFYTTLGQQIHRQRVYYGHNNIDLSGAPSGVYTWRIVDGSKEIRSGTVSRM